MAVIALENLNYRKAKKGEVCCEICVYGKRNLFPGKNTRYRCSNSSHLWYAVGKNMTCIHAMGKKTGTLGDPRI